MLVRVCRMVGYLGGSAPLSALVAAPPHSLERQSWQARELVSATVNADGWGAAAWMHGDPAPCVYVSTAPIWADVNAGHLGRALRSHCLLAAVRSATDPRNVGPANTQPFASGSVAFLHNGWIDAFAERIRRRLLGALSDERFAAIRGATDSEHLFALILEELDRSGGPGDARRLLAAANAACLRVAGWAREAGGDAHFAVLLADGDSLVALRTSTGLQPPTLYLLPEAGPIAPGPIVASEPLDADPRWTPIPPGHGVVIERSAPPQVVAPG